ncbi:Ubiquitin C-terminal hydrolases superfamily protein [Prunus dulcis]|uniref:Ubiquitin C-terminal hydrolases superfamily protein n=1 Tax=Prunus dulcis TaxID=3755 RepID=A0A4Y1REL7_PRUDU|nr:Ubiquitin C-terminal hydrolases superfamily protein [Prunus dulcis]
MNCSNGLFSMDGLLMDVSTLKLFYLFLLTAELYAFRREDEDNVRVNAEGFESDPKRQKRNGHSSPSSSPPPPASEGFLLPGFNYGDEDDEDNYRRPPVNDYRGDGGDNQRDLKSGVEVEEADEDDNDDLEQGLYRRSREIEVRRDCPYLDTVNRQYYQGRGKKSHAYPHSLKAGHHVYINLRTEKVYCLPDGYEISDPSLDDIRHVLNPRFTEEQVEQIDKNKQWSRALDGSDYLPGMNYQHCKSPLVHRFGELTRKIWHARNFKGQVSPHEFLQAVMKASKKRFRIGEQSDPVEFMSWLLNTLHADLRTSKKDSSIVYECFQVPLFNILKKFDGETLIEVVRPRIARMRYRVTRLPQYLILHMRRFTKNNFFNLELKDYIPLPTPRENERLHSKYDLIANIVHDGKPGEGSYRAFVQRKSEELWIFMFQKLFPRWLPFLRLICRYMSSSSKLGTVSSAMVDGLGDWSFFYVSLLFL